MVERYVRDVEVASSNLVTSTKLAVFTAKEPQGSDTLRLFFCWKDTMKSIIPKNKLRKSSIIIDNDSLDTQKEQ